MRQIFKYPVHITNTFTLALPRGAQVLTVQMQATRPQLWALVDEREPREERRFLVCGTGELVGAEFGRHISTIQDGGFVWHFFEAA